MHHMRFAFAPLSSEILERNSETHTRGNDDTVINTNAHIVMKDAYSLPGNPHSLSDTHSHFITGSS